MSSPQVTIVVLNWNGRADTLACLASLGRLSYPNVHTVVVDNGSTDGSEEAVRERFPSVDLLPAGENLGFTGGNNLGMEHALATGCDYVMLLNNDTVVDPDLLAHLVGAAEADPDVGMVGPTIYYYHEPDVIWSAGGRVDWQRGYPRMEGLNQRDHGQFGGDARDVDFITGCAILVKREVVDRIGLLDDRFFAYYEEVEWCVRTARAGYRIVHVPAARMWHKIRPSDRADSPQVHYYMTRNRLLLLKTVGAGLGPWLRTLIGDYLRTLISWSVLPKWRHKGPQRRAMVWAIRDAWRNRWGPRPLPEGLV